MKCDRTMFEVPKSPYDMFETKKKCNFTMLSFNSIPFYFLDIKGTRDIDNIGILFFALAHLTWASTQFVDLIIGQRPSSDLHRPNQHEFVEMVRHLFSSSKISSLEKIRERERLLPICGQTKLELESVKTQ